MTPARTVLTVHTIMLPAQQQYHHPLQRSPAFRQQQQQGLMRPPTEQNRVGIMAGDDGEADNGFCGDFDARCRISVHYASTPALNNAANGNASLRNAI